MHLLLFRPHPQCLIDFFDYFSQMDTRVLLVAKGDQ